MTYYGIDVSSYQASIDWGKVTKTENTFAIIRAGGINKHGEKFKDSYFEKNYKEAKQNGMFVGAYYFAPKTFLGADEGEAEAKHFCELIKGKVFDYPVFLDVEVTPLSEDARATDACIAFCDYMEKQGYYVGIYASDISGFKERLEATRLSAYDKWVARYGSTPQYVKTYGMWQKSSKGNVSGINGDVDLDEAYKDYPSIMAKNGLNGYKKGNPTPPTEVIYTVVKGDNLTKIAKKYNTTWKKLADYNKIANPNVIHVGDKIKIPR